MEIDLTTREVALPPEGRQAEEASAGQLVWTSHRVLTAVDGELLWSERRELVLSRRASLETGASTTASAPATLVPAPRQSGPGLIRE